MEADPHEGIDDLAVGLSGEADGGLRKPRCTRCGADLRRGMFLLGRLTALEPPLGVSRGDTCVLCQTMASDSPQRQVEHQVDFIPSGDRKSWHQGCDEQGQGEDVD